MDRLVVSTAAMGGAFARSLTGFGGSIIFELVYNVSAQAHVGDLSSAVLMVSLGCMFEILTSTVLVVLVFRDAILQYRILLGLAALSLPATLAGTALLSKFDANPHALASLRIGLNGLFLLVSLYKLTPEVKSKELILSESLLQTRDSNPTVLFRELRFDMMWVGLLAGFLNGFVGLPGPVIMVYFATAMSSGKIGVTEGYAITQGFFMLTTIFRAIALESTPGTLDTLHDQWALFAALPVPSLLALLLGFWLRPRINPAIVLKVILVLLLLSSLLGTGALQGTISGLCSVACTLAWASWLILRRSASPSGTFEA